MFKKVSPLELQKDAKCGENGNGKEMMRQVGKCTLSIHKSLPACLPDAVWCTFVLRYIV